MRLQRTYYEVLGLPRTATPQEIKSKYHDLARQFHPDRAQDKVLAERLFVQINIAYRTLMDTDKRSIYDAGLFQSDTSKTDSKSDQPIANNAMADQDATVKPSGTSPAKSMIADLLKRAQSAYMGGDRITAHKLCMQVVGSDASNSDARILIGDIYCDQGRKPEALTEYKLAAKGGNASRLLQEKINRLETKSKSPVSKPTESVTKSVNDQIAKHMPSNESNSASKKKESLLDRIIGRTR